MTEPKAAILFYNRKILRNVPIIKKALRAGYDQMHRNFVSL